MRVEKNISLKRNDLTMRDFEMNHISDFFCKSGVKLILELLRFKDL